MKSAHVLRGFLPMMIVLSSIAAAQTVQFDINLPNYDVIYLADLVDIRSGRIADNIPEMSIEMRTDSPTPIQVWFEYTAQIELRGDSRKTVATGHSNDFTLNGVRRLSSRDLSGRGAADIQMTTDKGSRDPDLEKKLKEYVERFPTAPAGSYYFSCRVYAAPYPSKTGGPLGQLQKVITVRNASENEVTISLISPDEGAAVPTPFPTFSWSSEKPEVILYVYEKLPIHRSPEEAVTGIPYLKRELRGVSTFTYPADAERRLETGKSYYWFLETKVLTTRGDLKKRSEIRLFRVLPGGSSNPLLLALSTMGGDVATRLANLIENGWQPSGATIDGSPATPADVNSLLQRLARESVSVNVSIE